MWGRFVHDFGLVFSYVVDMLNKIKFTPDCDTKVFYVLDQLIVWLLIVVETC